MLTKQEKGAFTTAIRAGARRVRIGCVVYVLAYRNRTKPWKWICAEAARLCGARATAVAKMREAVYAYSQMEVLRDSPLPREVPVIPADFDLERYVREVDEMEAFAAAIAREQQQFDWIMRHGQWLQPVVPGMRRGRKRRR